MRVLRRLRYWRERARRSEELREEMELHLAERAAELEAEGMTAAGARDEARRRFGNAELRQEEAREVWMTRFFMELGQDLRYGFRTLVGNKMFSALAVLSLALGIGANTTIYSFMESILLRSLPVARPEELVVFNWGSAAPRDGAKGWAHVMHGLQGMGWPAEKGRMMSGMYPYRAFEFMRENNPAFSVVFGYFDGRHVTLGLKGQAQSASTEYVSGEYFRGLEVAAAAGRMIGQEDDRPGAAPVAVVSYALSEARFGGAAQAVGQSITVDQVAFTVIGVAPPAFFGVDPARVPDLYLPLHSNVLVEGEAASRRYADENFYWVEMMGRLKEGVTLEQAQGMLAPKFQRWVAGTATTEAERARLPELKLNAGSAGLGGLRRRYSKPLYVLVAMVGLILAISCANIANLLLARAAARRREMAVRLSLGAGRWRIVRQLLTESVMLAALGGACGVGFAVWGVRALTLLFSNGQENFTLHAELNWNVMGVTAALSVVCGLLFGLAPALQATRADVMPTLKDGRGGGAKRRWQQVLVVGQIACSFLILVAAGLFVRTLDRLHEVELGYAKENVLLFTLNAAQAGHKEPETARFYAELRRRFETLPGVRSATLSHASMISAPRAGQAVGGTLAVGTVEMDGVRTVAAGEKFLTTMRIPLLVGREIDERDVAEGQAVAVVTARMARKYFDNENPVGRRIRLVEQKRELEVVGVAGDVRFGGLKGEEDESMTVFVAASQFPTERATYALRVAGDPLRLVAGVHEVVWGADARIPVTNVMTQTAEIDRTITQELTFARLCTGFAVLALLTACVGLYGTVSYSVTQRFGEIGIRMALGAQRAAMVWMVLKRVVWLAGLGLAAGLPVAVVGSRLVKSFLYGTVPGDPVVLGLGCAVLLGAAVAAGLGPAMRASRIDPLVAVRHE